MVGMGNRGAEVAGGSPGLFDAEIRVPVAAGRGVCVRAGEVDCEFGSFVFGMRACCEVTVGEGVRVTEGVAVGIVGVTVGVSEVVGVGAVEVGKGPKSDWAVMAIAVLVLFAFL